jgi:tetratricopeptide (TPR) repeat protein
MVHRFSGIVGPLILIVFLIGFSFKTWARVPDWKDQLSIDRSAVKVSENSAKANCYMGTILFEKAYMSKNKAMKQASVKQNVKVTKSDTLQQLNLLDTIDIYISKALRIYPDYGSALVIRSGMNAEYFKLGRYNLQKLLDNYNTLIHTRKDLPFIIDFMTYLNKKVIARMNNEGVEVVRNEDLMNREKLKAFYLSAFDFYADTLRNNKKGFEYLQLAEQIAPNDPEVIKRVSLIK